MLSGPFVTMPKLQVFHQYDEWASCIINWTTLSVITLLQGVEFRRYKRRTSCNISYSFDSAAVHCCSVCVFSMDSGYLISSSSK